MPEWIMQAAGYVALGGAVYGGIRADLKAMHEKIKDIQETANQAHQRIDSLLIRK